MDPSKAEVPISMGGFIPIENVKGEWEVEAATLAVKKYNELNKKNLSFKSTVEGEYQPPARYKMVITATKDGCGGGDATATLPMKYRVEFFLEKWMAKEGDRGCKIFTFEPMEC